MNIGPGSMWTLDLHNLKAIFVDRNSYGQSRICQETSLRSHIVTQSKIYISQAFVYIGWNEISQKSQSSKRQNSLQMIILTQEIRNGHTTPKNNIKHALQQPVWQESIVTQYRKNLTVKSYSMPLYR